MSEPGGGKEWEVHPLVRVPLHRSQCQVCQEYRNHAAIEMESGDTLRLMEDMARVWGKEGGGEVRNEVMRLREECKEAREEIKKLDKLAEESRRTAEIEIERLRRQVEELQRPPEGDMEEMKKRIDGLESLVGVWMRCSSLSGDTSGERHRWASPGPRELRVPRSLSNQIITQNIPGTSIDCP